MLVLADEDYTGVNPIYPAGTTAPRYAQQYVAALTGQRHPLGGLGRRQGRRAARPRRARPLRRGGLVPRRQPADPGRGRRAGAVGDRAAPGLAGRRPREGPRCSTCGPTSTRAASCSTPARRPATSARCAGPTAAASTTASRGIPSGRASSRRASATTASCSRMTSIQYYLGAFDRARRGRADRVHGHGHGVRRLRTPAWPARRPTRWTRRAASRSRARCCPPGSSRCSGARRAGTTPARPGRSSRSRASGTSPAPTRTTSTGG